jgi:hypothetical protein
MPSPFTGRSRHPEDSGASPRYRGARRCGQSRGILDDTTPDFENGAGSGAEQQASLIKLTGRYCVLHQTL